MKYIDADKLIAEIERRINWQRSCIKNEYRLSGKAEEEIILEYKQLLKFITSLQQEQQMPDSTQLIAEWEKEKAVLEQKDFRGDAERMAYNAFLDGFVKGLGLNARKEE